MLENATYVGDVHRHGEIIGRGRHDAIIDRELWDRVQVVRNDRARRPQVHGARPARPYLLSGVARCADCGSPLWVNTISGGRYHYYRCSSRSRGDDCPSGKGSQRFEWPEEQVSLLFGGSELPDAWQDRVADLVEQDSRSVDRKVERRRWEQRIARVRQGLIDGLLDTATTKKAITEAEAALAKLSETPHASIAAGSMLTDIGELWPHMTDEERHQLVRLILN